MPGIDVRDELEEILLYPQVIGSRRHGHDRVREAFWENLSPIAAVKRDRVVFSLDQGLGDPLALAVEEEEEEEESEEGEVGLARRVINIFHDQPKQPGLLTVLREINASNITMQYARWQAYQGGRMFPAGPMLELAYYVPAGTAFDGLRDQKRGVRSP